MNRTIDTDLRSINQPDPSQQVRPYVTSGGAQIFQIPLLAFPGLWGYVYLVLVQDSQLGEMKVLIDAGSGYGESDQHLIEGIAQVSHFLDRSFSLGDITHILITHGHIDHFGGLNFIRTQTTAPLGIHELDRRTLTHYTERLSVVARRLDEYLIEAGVSDERRQRLLEMYRLTKALFQATPVDFTFEAIGMRLGPFEMLHVPGHCAGHVVIRLDDVLFSGDHVLTDTSPHQAPEQLTQSTGLDHYLKSLDYLENWAGDVKLTLGGHKHPINNLPTRLDEIRLLHRQRLQKVLDVLRNPATIAEVSQALFSEVHGYNVLLALEEAGAHVEYLYQRGQLAIHNLADLENSNGPVPLLYRCVDCLVSPSGIR